MDELKKKLGPLPLWQWIAIGAALGLAVAFYRRSHPSAASDAVATATPADAEFNPIDPTTGLPISGGISGGAATDTGAAGSGGSLADLLGNFGALEQLMAGLQEITPGPAVDTGGDSVAIQTGVKKAAKKATKPKAKPKAKKKTAAKKNPGHHTISHGHGKKTATSSAPHNPRQHHNVSPPAHQRHPPTRHASAKHPAAKRSNPAKKPARRSTQRHFMRRG